MPGGATVEAYEVDHVFPGIGRRVMRVNARKVHRPGNGAEQVLPAIEDGTDAADLEREAERQRRLAQGIVDTLREPLLVLDGDLGVIAASRSFYRSFGVEETATIGARLPELGNGQWNIPALLDLLERVVPEHATVEGFEVAHDFPGIGRRTMLLNARKIFREGNNTKTFLLAIEDVTDRRRLEAERAAALAGTEALLQELSHRVMNSLSIISAVVSMEGRQLSDEAAKAAFERLSARVMAVAELYKSLSVSKSVEAIDAPAFLGSICEDVVRSLQDGRFPVRLDAAIDPFLISTRQAIAVGLVLNELLTNAIKYAFKGRDDGLIRVAVRHAGGAVDLSVADNGAGIDADARVDSGVGQKPIDLFSLQLDGRLTRHSDAGGTRVRLVFRLG
ncbi:MAG: PAS domain-containing protein [Geminicoccaceae bacterium]|nr:PAS domain-containing protein [Geminicoccaceae bacterium]